jgi:perosamine synthetase
VKNSTVNSIIQALRKVLSEEKDFIALHEPVFNGNEWRYLKDCLDSGWVSTAGDYVDVFESRLAEFTGSKYAIAVINGTAALQLCLTLVGVCADDEVLMPSLTFVATANAATYCGAIPHFIDSEERTLGICPETLEVYLSKTVEIKDNECFNKKTGRRIKAVVPMHTFGHPVDLDPLSQICERFSITMVEDAAESMGSYYKGVHTGNQGKASAFSFNGNKVITTGGGGAILTNDESIAKKARHLSTTARVSHKWEYDHDCVGYNYRLPNINASLGCAQLEQLPEFLNEKRLLADRYRDVFEDVEGVSVFTEPDFARSNYWLNVLLLDEANHELRDEILELTNKQGIMTRPVWKLMHKLRMYKDCPRMELHVSENLEKRLINIPSSVVLNGQN